jgi:integrase
VARRTWTRPTCEREAEARHGERDDSPRYELSRRLGREPTPRPRRKPAGAAGGPRCATAHPRHRPNRVERGLPVRRPPRLARRQPRRRTRTSRKAALDTTPSKGEQLAHFLNHAGPRRHLFELLAYTGLRIGEALGLTWADIDHQQGLIHVRRQLTRQRKHGPLKTPASNRDVMLPAAIGKELRDRWLASPFKAPDDPVFATSTGRGLDYRNVGTDFRTALKRAGISTNGRLSLHSLRHGYASLPISNGLNVVYVSRQLGRDRDPYRPGERRG